MLDEDLIKDQKETGEAVSTAKKAQFDFLENAKHLKLLVKNENVFNTVYMKGISAHEGLPKLDVLNKALKNNFKGDLTDKEKEKKELLINAINAVKDADDADVKTFNKMYAATMKAIDKYFDAVEALDAEIVKVAKDIKDNEKSSAELKKAAEWIAEPSADRVALKEPYKAFAKQQKAADQEDKSQNREFQ